jgi:glutathione synthase/RimK-type ligase-like ATP-grasp enzyme
MIQPFLESIHSVGEYSLYFFEGNFSHAIVKKPQQGDFRVQEDFGGTQESITPSDKLMQAAKAVVKHLPEGTFYARVDLLPDSKEDFVLMELELIEPGMYFRFCDNAAENFANAIEAKLA